MINWICYKLRRFLPDSVVTELYHRAGLAWGDVHSYIPIAGKCEGYNQLRDRYVSWDFEILKRGLARVEPRAFVLVGGGYVSDLTEAQNLIERSEQR